MSYPERPARACGRTGVGSVRQDGHGDDDRDVQSWAAPEETARVV